MLLPNSVGREQLQGLNVIIFSLGRVTNRKRPQAAGPPVVSSAIHLLPAAGEVLQALAATFGQEAGYRALGALLLARGYLGSALKVS